MLWSTSIAGTSFVWGIQHHCCPLRTVKYRPPPRRNAIQNIFEGPKVNIRATKKQQLLLEKSPFSVTLSPVRLFSSEYILVHTISERMAHQSEICVFGLFFFFKINFSFFRLENLPICELHPLMTVVTHNINDRWRGKSTSLMTSTCSQDYG